MGVAGAGKTTIGRQLAERLNWTFLDADDFHPPDNIAKMARGEPLDDEDRAPWLDAMRQALFEARDARQPIVLAASVLKESYRLRLVRELPGVEFVYLAASPELIARRLAEREDHFMKSGMLASQFEALEAPEQALVVAAGLPQEAIVAAIVDALAAANRRD